MINGFFLQNNIITLTLDNHENNIGIYLYFQRDISEIWICPHRYMKYICDMDHKQVDSINLQIRQPVFAVENRSFANILNYVVYTLRKEHLKNPHARHFHWGLDSCYSIPFVPLAPIEFTPQSHIPFDASGLCSVNNSLMRHSSSFLCQW